MNREQPRMTEGQQRARSLASSEHLALIIQGEDVAAVEKLDEVAKAIGDALHRDLTTSQIRNVFGAVRTIELAVKSQPAATLSLANHRQLVMLKSKLAYQVGRESNRFKKTAIETLAVILADAIDLVGNNSTYFGSFIQFFEAILAYHKYYGGQ